MRVFLFWLYLFSAVGWLLLALGYWEPTPLIITAAFAFLSLDMLFACLKKFAGE